MSRLSETPIDNKITAQENKIKTNLIKFTDQTPYSDVQVVGEDQNNVWSPV